MFYQNILLIGIFRHLVASRTIEAGEIILKENSLIFGPQGSKTICLGCCLIVTENSPRCEKCGYPLCSKACANSEMHKTFECEPLMKSGWFKTVPYDFLKSPEVFYEMILLLRTFLLREKDPERWALIWNLESHKTEHEEALAFGPVLLTAVDLLVKLLQITSGLLEVDIDTITTILGIFNVNQFAETSSGILFGLASMAMHDCGANTSDYISLAEEGHIMTFKALMTIKEGEPITITYNDPMTTVLERQDKLAGKFFVVRIFCFSSRQWASLPF
jgi:hypothetical protein